MKAPTANLLRILRRNCQHQLRPLSTSCARASGHNKWSTIKHDKAKNDALKNKKRSVFAHELELASKLGGANPDDNPHLARVLAAAKKAGFPKASIEAAIMRGQGIAPGGSQLESLRVEALLPPGVAVIVESLTDNKARTLQELRLVITKTHNGQLSPTKYLFDMVGRVAFKPAEVDLDTALEAGLEVDGCLDVESQDGRIVVTTEPPATKVVADTLARSLELEVDELDMVWVPKDEVPVADATALQAAIAELNNHSAVQGVYTNAAGP
ncbi:glucose-1-phosphate adenylyltransferase [Trichodelitschia bisporula]|uniref:Glucose-1-phosphate adenylyltransferase n=1 Tax=Trichodelitschia bisporula TaxID=703511 RepID=A0A6G1HQX8_9PEZI|nr:glucose-1-phosphate adenylyltransferase [Trichodelitschia bisporula]